VHLAPQRLAVVVEVRDPREGPKKSRYPFERIVVDLRYLDAKPGGVQSYSCTLLEGLSRAILAGSLTTDQEAGVLLRLLYHADVVVIEGSSYRRRESEAEKAARRNTP